MRIRKGDKVRIIKGKDRGREGTVERVSAKSGGVVVAGINIYKKHLKPSARKKEGGIIEIQKPLPVANVMLICPHCQKPARIGFRLEGDQKKRFCKKCQQEFR
jgi:large subunit ribosomal protein L24